MELYIETFGFIEKKIQGELLTYFQNELSTLSDSISRIKDNTVRDEVKAICNNINICKAKIGGKIKEFANVFEKRDVSYMDFTMSELIDTCLEIITKLNGSMTEVKLENNISDDGLYKGENFPYFVDAVNILINNALEHCGLINLSELNLKINIEKERDKEVLDVIMQELAKKKIKVAGSDFLRLSITNTLSTDIDILKLQEKIQQIFNKTKDTETVKKYSQSEGGTGLYKLYKTFQYNINMAYSIIYSIEDYMFNITIILGTKNILVEKERE